MRNGPGPQQQEVDALIEQLRQASRLQRALPGHGGAESAADWLPQSSSELLDGYLAELARRSHPRTELPLRFRRFPLTLPPVRNLALRVYNLLTREQRAGNVLVRDALQALHASVARADGASRETEILIAYIRALLMRGTTVNTSGDEPRTSPSHANDGTPPPAMDAFLATLGDEFRGSIEMIRNRLRVYLNIILAEGLGGPVLDLGCGRGEWLELMREADIQGIGVEQNRVLAAACAAKNLPVIGADLVAFLEQSPAEHWRIVTGFHVIEHLGWPAWYECLRHVHRALSEGGMVILETPNPASQINAANRFYLDPTHRQLLPDALLAFAARTIGFTKVEILPLPSTSNATEATGGRANAANSASIRAINAPQDYALIARK
ncbi:MAG: class I SAM-dependent methyltransferase [Pseudomonadota bacterium]|nr:class I SAM-dependent methyltransferase [Pseudomonadota bacterium]